MHYILRSHMIKCRRAAAPAPPLHPEIIIIMCLYEQFSKSNSNYCILGASPHYPKTSHSLRLQGSRVGQASLRSALIE